MINGRPLTIMLMYLSSVSGKKYKTVKETLPSHTSTKYKQSCDDHNESQNSEKKTILKDMNEDPNQLLQGSIRVLVIIIC